jgi:poly [ADP-ribose] polymerase
MALKTTDKPGKFPANYDVLRKIALNFTDIGKNNNKYYSAEIQVAKSGEVRIFTDYGRVGGTPANDIRVCQSTAHAEKEFDKLIKSKIKKGYTEIKLVKSEVGSEVAKSKIENDVVSSTTLDQLKVKFNEFEAKNSKLHTEVQGLIKTLFGNTAMFVQRNLDTAKCPLGQLSLEQIGRGRGFLDEARKLIQTKDPDIQELNKLTSSYYTNIPHVLGHKINADALRFDTDDKIDRALDILDVFADAKNIEKILGDKNSVDSQYDSLKADLEYIDPTSAIHKWIDAMFHETRAANHKFLGKIRINRIFRLGRHNEPKYFNDTIAEIARECGKHNPPDILKNFVKTRPDLNKDLAEVYAGANVFPVWHGTRTANVVGITTRGLLIRPSGVVHAGSMFGDGIYWASNSSKSINYTDAKGSHWTGGNSDNAYLFLADCAFGNQMELFRSRFITKKDLKNYHSVWAREGEKLYNDEFVVYNPSGPNQQHQMRYLVEFSTKA